jgi:peptidoglycan/LPS O-acetylase OafA/YrhL
MGSAGSSRRIPTLDGWRGIAIMMVMITHYQVSYLGHFFDDQSCFNLGQHGVTIFFVLSGYLITTKLLAEKKINLPQFYGRRFFRIVPAAWTYLLMLCALTAFTSMKVIDGDLWACLLSFRNYVFERPAITCTEHFWSLAVEEQFYLVWPAALALLGRRNGLIAATAGALSIAGLRALYWNYYLQKLRFLHTEVRADALLIGCILALLLERDLVRDWFGNVGRRLIPIFLALFAADIYCFHSLIPLHESILIALVMGAGVVNPGTRLGRFLEFDYLASTGIISYSLYLWQGLFLRSNWGVLGFVLVPLAAICSWRFIEQPGIKLGKKLLLAKR